LAGVVADVKHDDQIDHHEDQASVKQSLMSSFKKNLYPALKEDIHQNNTDPSALISGTPRRKWSFLALLNIDVEQC